MPRLERLVWVGIETMSPNSNLNDCESAELTCAYAAQALASSEVAAAEAQSHRTFWAIDERTPEREIGRTPFGPSHLF